MIFEVTNMLAEGSDEWLAFFGNKIFLFKICASVFYIHNAKVHLKDHCIV